MTSHLHSYATRPLASLKPYERNARTHSPEQVAQIAASIREFGFTNPLLVDEQDRVIAGHGRLEAARSLGLAEVPVIVVAGLTDAQRRALVLADNKLALNAGWDADLLKAELADLKLDGFDLGLTGFGEGELLDILGGSSPPGADPDAAPEPPVTPFCRLGDVWTLGPHRLVIGDSTDVGTYDALLGSERVDIVWTDPPYNVAYESKLAGSIQNDDMGAAEFLDFLRAFYAATFTVMKPGAAIYVAHADTEGLSFRRAFTEAGLKLSGCLVWAKDSLVLGRSDYQWQHEPCQPAGTIVRTPNGEMPIESLKDGDRVVSYDPYSGTITGMRDGRAVKVATRHYRGDLYGVRVGDRITWATDSHKFTVRFHDSSRAVWCTYLMRRGKWWRVGITKTYDARGFGLKNRFKTERADEAWIITTHTNRLDALCMEQILSVGYGIPRTHWTTERGAADGNCRTKEHIERIYSSLDLEKMERNANDLLEAHGRRRRFPFLTRDNLSQKCSTRVTVQVQACNLIPEIMSVPIPYAKWDGLKTFDWEPIDAVERRPHDGPVYSLDVEKDKHYIADGIVTHNCLYGWKPGSRHRWFGGRKLTTLQKLGDGSPFAQADDGSWVVRAGDRALVIRGDVQVEEVVPSVINEPKPKRSDVHPTMKPVALIERMLRNSARPGDLVLDPFGGSGSTLVAADRLGMSARLIELDPKFGDVIIRRWQDYTGRRAERDDGTLFPMEQGDGRA